MTVSAASAASGTASARSVSGPSVIGRKPSLTPALTSAGDQPPSGPTISATASGVSPDANERTGRG